MLKQKFSKITFLKIFVVRKNIKAFLLLFLLFLTQLSCSTTDPKLEPDLKLELKDVSCTEAWLQLTTTNIQLPAIINLLKNNSLTQTFSLSTQDSLIYIDSLLPNQNYSFQVSSIQHQVSSNELTASTLDTTSHNFTFETFTFGQHSSSTLYDVWIFDENNIWAVGEINVADTSINGFSKYCYLKWNGIQWEQGMLKYFPPGSIGDSITTTGRSIFAFSQDDVWISGGAVFHWDGVHWNIYYNTGAESANKIWGTSSDDLYFVGRNGSIAHFNGSQWTRLESGTNLDIYDIWGDYNEKINEFEIIAVASKVLVNQEKKIIKINKTDNVTSLPTNGIPSNLTGIWFKNKVFYVVGSGMFRKNDIESSSEWKAFHYGLTNYHISDIRGNDYNDIIASGSFGELVHFNGINWKSYTDETYMNGAWGGTIKGNIICCVGLENNKAIITIGKR